MYATPATMNLRFFKPSQIPHLLTAPNVMGKFERFIQLLASSLKAPGFIKLTPRVPHLVLHLRHLRNLLHQNRLQRLPVLLRPNRLARLIKPIRGVEAYLIGSLLRGVSLPLGHREDLHRQK